MNTRLFCFMGTRVLVVGDVMLDQYWWGGVSRISPEAPVPVVHKQRYSAAAGGAGNVACNLAALGAVPVLLGVRGHDNAGKELCTVLESNNVSADHLLLDSSRPTTVKLRILAQNQHIVRVDEERDDPISDALSTKLFDMYCNLLDSVDIVLISDYAKGVLRAELLHDLFRAAGDRGLRVIVDPKGYDLTRYNRAYLLCANLREALVAARIPLQTSENVNVAGKSLLAELLIHALLITQGERGMTLFERDAEPFAIPALVRSACDVTGAGDTAIAVMALSIANDFPLRQAADLANRAAGFAVEQLGTAIVSLKQLEQSLAPESTHYPSTSLSFEGRSTLD